MNKDHKIRKFLQILKLSNFKIHKI